MPMLMYWVRTEEERLTFYDFYQRSYPRRKDYPSTVIDNGSWLLREPVTLDDGRVFGETDRLSVIVKFSANDDNVKKMIEKGILVKERLVISYSRDGNYDKSLKKFAENPEKYQYFEKVTYDMVKYLNKQNHYYIDGSVPSRDFTELFNWLIFVPSKELHDRILDAFFEENELQNQFGYCIIKGVLETKDGRTFGKHDEETLFLKIFTSFDYNAVYKLIETGIIDKKLAIQQRHIKDSMFQDVRRRDLDNMTISYQYLPTQEFKEYFSEKSYTFEDGSRLTLDNTDLFQRQLLWWIRDMQKRREDCRSCGTKLEERRLNFREEGTFCNICGAKLD